MDFFGSEIGVAIAWVCTVASFAYALYTSSSNKKLKQDLKVQQQAKQALTNQINEMNAKSVDQSNNDVTQSGEKNIYIKRQSGGMKINM